MPNQLETPKVEETVKKPVRVLTDSRTVSLQLVEGGEGSKVRLRGEFARCGVATENKRVYPHRLWEREIGRLSKAMSGRQLFGECDHPCLASDDFRVLTSEGWRPFRDIKVGDRVWSRLDGSTALSTVLDIVDQPYEGPVYRVKNRNIDSVFTPGHRFLLHSRPDTNGAVDAYATVAEIAANPGKFAHSAIPRTAAFYSESPEFFIVPGVQGAGNTKVDVSQPLKVPSKLFAAMMGMYLSEGSLAHTGYRVNIHQSTDWSRKLMLEELSKFPEIEWAESRNEIYVSDARLYAFLKPLGDAYEKFIPREVKNLGVDALKDLIFWFTIGDGRFLNARGAPELPEGETFKSTQATSLREAGPGVMTNTRQDVFSVSERLVRDLHECLVRTGGSGSLSVVYPDQDYEFAGRIIKAENKVPLHQLHVSNASHIWMDPRSMTVEEQQHAGNIFCLSVTHGNFYMEQNGKAFWTGNSDSRTQLARVSHLLTNLEIRDGLVIGEAEILDTERGRNLKAILQAGGRIGISSRGYGSTATNEKGEDVVQDDYRLVTFDFVADPADQSAYPDVFYEHKEENMSEEQKAAEFMQQIEVAKREASVSTEAALRAEFAEELVKQFSKFRSDITEQVRGELLADPGVAGARTALDKVKEVLRPFVLPEDAKAVAEEKDAELSKLRAELAEGQLKIQTLEEEYAQLASMAKEVGYKFFVEQRIGGDPDAAFVRRLLGDVKTFASAADLKDRLEAVQAELRTKRAAEAELAESANREEERNRERQARDYTRALAAEKSLSEENAKLRSALDKSLEANERLAVQVYAEGRMAHHPKASKIRSLIESAAPQSREAVDTIIGEFREATRDAESLEQTRARIRATTRGGFGPSAVDEETASPKAQKANDSIYQQLGVSSSELKRLAGMGG